MSRVTNCAGETFGGLLVTLKIAVASSTSSNMATYSIVAPTVEMLAFTWSHRNCPPCRGIWLNGPPFKLYQLNPGNITGRYSLLLLSHQFLSSDPFVAAQLLTPLVFEYLPTIHGLTISASCRVCWNHESRFVRQSSSTPNITVQPP